MKHTALAFVTAIIVALISYAPALPAEAGEGGGRHSHGAHAGHTHAGEAGEATVSLETAPEQLSTGMPTFIFFVIKDSKGAPVQELTATHDRMLHAVIIGEDFSVFGHIHPEDSGPLPPEMRARGRYPVRFTFPKAGRYLIAVDGAIQGRHFSQQFLVSVAGGPRMAGFAKDVSREKRFGEYTVTLTATPERIVAGREATLGFHISENGRPVTDLEPYLSAPLHLAILLTDLNSFVHAHGELPDGPPGHPPVAHVHGEVPHAFGPRIEARVVFPVKGTYQVFGELQHQGRVVVISFMVEAE